MKLVSLALPFTYKETEIHEGQLSYPRSQSSQVVQPGIEPRSVLGHSNFFDHYDILLPKLQLKYFIEL